MTFAEAHALTDHPARDRFLWQARDDNEDLGQRDAARATLVRLAKGETRRLPTRPDPPTPDDLALQAYVAGHGCCGGSTG